MKVDGLRLKAQKIEYLASGRAGAFDDLVEKAAGNPDLIGQSGLGATRFDYRAQASNDLILRKVVRH